MTDPTPQIPTTNSYSNPEVNKTSLINSGRTYEIALLLVILILSAVFLSLFPLNYFNVINLSSTQPTIFGFLPDQNTVANQASSADLASYLSLAKKLDLKGEQQASVGQPFTIEGVYSGYGTNSVQVVTRTGKEKFSINSQTLFSQVEYLPDPNIPTQYSNQETPQVPFSFADLPTMGTTVRITYSYYNNMRIATAILAI